MKTGNPRMINESTTVTIQNRICHIYRYGKTEINTHRIPVFYWGTGAAGRESVEKIASCLDKYMSTEQMPADGFILAAYESENWNDDFSPWEAPAVFGRENFGGKADATLGWLVQHYIPYVEAKTSKTARFSVGYSLAGFLVCGYTVSAICLQARSAVPVPCGMRDGLIMSEKRGQRCAGTARDTSI